MSSKVRVRFAPSPTGPLHVGGVRTALYNYLFAKKHGGDFLLRIEDTDQARYVEGAEDYIVKSLEWAGISFNEGPGKEGQCGPYRQSERKHLYRQYADQLVDNGLAYYAFDTSKELDEMRERIKASGKQAAKYDMFTREYMKNSLTLPADEVKQRLDNGEPHVIRIKIPRKQEVRLHDEVRGWVSVKSEEMDDKVLFKGDGMPTYHLANIVDDHLMGITHVIRGEEWLPSAPLHHLLYQFLGWEDTMPKFAHLPLILKPDPSTYISKRTKQQFAAQFASEFANAHDADEDKSRNIVEQLFNIPKDIKNALKPSAKDDALKAEIKAFLKKAMYGKLSKRDGDRLGFPVFPLSWDLPSGEHISGYREEGYMPGAFINILVMLGWNPGTNQEVFSKDELIEAFSLERVGKSGAKFDPDKARWYNQQFLRNKPNEDLATEFMATLAKKGIQNVDNQYVAKVCGLVKEKASFMDQFWDLGAYFFQAPSDYEEHVIAKKWDDEAKQLFGNLQAALEKADDWNAENIEATYTNLAGEHAGKYMQLLRVLVTGAGAGPAIYPTLALIGQNEVAKRLDTALEKLA